LPIVCSFDLPVRTIAIQSGRAYTFAPISQITDAVALPRVPQVAERLCDRRAARTLSITQTLVNEAFVRQIDHQQVEVQNHAYLFGGASTLLQHILAQFAREQ